MDFLKEKFYELMKKIYYYGNKYYEEKKDFYDIIMNINEQKGIFCERKWIGKYLLQFVFFFTILKH